MRRSMYQLIQKVHFYSRKDMVRLVPECNTNVKEWQQFCGLTVKLQ